MVSIILKHFLIPCVETRLRLAAGSKIPLAIMSCHFFFLPVLQSMSIRFLSWWKQSQLFK